MNAKTIYSEIEAYLYDRFNILGINACNPIMRSISSQRLHTYNPKKAQQYRIRTHVCLHYLAGWLKTAILNTFGDLLGAEMCLPMDSITQQLLEGSSHKNENKKIVFDAPHILMRPYFLTDELGTLTGTKGGDEVIQTLLKLLEDGRFSVGKLKLGEISKASKKDAEKKYSFAKLQFHASSLKYVTNFVHIAATYDPKFLADDAYKSRYEFVTPNFNFDKHLAYEVTRDREDSDFPHLDEDIIASFRRMLHNKDYAQRVDLSVPFLEKKQIDAIDDKDNPMTPRDWRNAKSFVINQRYWGFEVTQKDQLKFIEQNISTSTQAQGLKDQIVVELSRCNNVMVSKSDIKKVFVNMGHKRSTIYHNLSVLEKSGVVIKYKDLEGKDRIKLAE